MSTLALSFVATSSLYSWDSCNSYSCSCYWHKKGECRVDRCDINWEIPGQRCGKVCYKKCEDHCQKRPNHRCEDATDNEW